jgi:hypothetical protein
VIGASSQDVLEFAQKQIDTTSQALRKPFLKKSPRASLSPFVALGTVALTTAAKVKLSISTP